MTITVAVYLSGNYCCSVFMQQKMAMIFVTLTATVQKVTTTAAVYLSSFN